MKKVLMLFILAYCLCHMTIANAVSDPFAEPSIMSCSEWSNKLITQLSEWHLKGIVLSPEKQEIVYQQMWLMNNEQRWLTVILPIVPLPLIPWKIKSMTASSVIWQTELPEYCQSSLLVNMFLGEK